MLHHKVKSPSIPKYIQEQYYIASNHSTSTKHLVLTYNSIFMIRSTAINLVLSCNETIKESLNGVHGTLGQIYRFMDLSLYSHNYTFQLLPPTYFFT